MFETEGMPGPTPVVVWIHGGALINGSRHGGAAVKYVDAGYRAISIDYRLAPETKLPDIIADVRDALSWIRRNAEPLQTDANRIGVVGHSAGGYLTLMTGTFDVQPQAVVSYYGYGDLVGDWYAKPNPYYLQQPLVTEKTAREQLESKQISQGRRHGKFYLYTRQQGTWPQEVAGVDPAVAPDFFTPYCPDQNVDETYPPTLLLHGTDDTDVPYELSVRMRDRLASTRVEHELITIEGGGHGFDWQWWSTEVKDAQERVIQFLDQHLK
ncbi:MAG: alpha/beta hydrolase [Candidatus Latescibacterota bacterium]|nr:alpha/beta hydrolase [Candidatus Latescibacterota bacterium]